MTLLTKTEERAHIVSEKGRANDREFLATLGGFEQHAWHEARKTVDPEHLNPYSNEDRKKMMTNHNNASETSGEAEIVGKLWAMHGIAQSSENGFTYLNDAARVLVGEAAETIERLVAERGALKKQSITNLSGAQKRIVKMKAENKRLVAAEKERDEANELMNSLAAELNAAKDRIAELEAERDAALSCARDLASGVGPLTDRAEAAEKERDAEGRLSSDLSQAVVRWMRAHDVSVKRVAELEAILSVATENSQRLEKKSYDLLAQVTELSTDFKREEFHRAHWKKKCAELEADLQRAREALEPFVKYLKTFDDGGLEDRFPIVDIDGDFVCTVGDLRRAALKGKQP